MSFSTSIKARLSPNAFTVLQKIYLREDEDGQHIETPADLFRLVVQAVTKAGKDYISEVSKFPNILIFFLIGGK